MISKERLNELIEQGAIIYSEQFKEILDLSLTADFDFFKTGYASCRYVNNRELIINLDKLHEINYYVRNDEWNKLKNYLTEFKDVYNNFDMVLDKINSIEIGYTYKPDKRVRKNK